MSEQATETPTQEEQPEAPAGAFGRDKQFGNRLDQVMALGEPFLLLGGKIEEATIETAYGTAEVAKVLVQKLSHETGAPVGAPIRANTVASAIVEKIKAITADELASGPVCQLQIVQAKKRGGKNALVMTWMRNLQDADDYSEFGLDASEVSKRVDGARAEGERIGY